jgi:hypothetical protein
VWIRLVVCVCMCVFAREHKVRVNSEVEKSGMLAKSEHQIAGSWIEVGRYGPLFRLQDCRLSFPSRSKRVQYFILEIASFSEHPA